MSDIINEVEIRVAGMRRSGNHAIINWLVSHYNDSVCFLNNCEIGNPLVNYGKDSLDKFNGNSLFDFEKEGQGDFRKKDCLIYSYEDKLLEDIFTEHFNDNHNKWLGKSKYRYDVLILRDPFNMFASRLFRWSRTKEFIFRSKKDSALWKSYAREYLGRTSLLSHNKIVINYNRWLITKNIIH